MDGPRIMVKVLIVDDSPTQIFTLRKLVEDWGYEALIAENGSEALQIARDEQPNVILMDIVMPGMSGFQTTRKLSKDQTTQSIPVIFVSTKSSDTDQAWGMRQGAAAFVTKPVNPELLAAAISNAVGA